MIKTVLIAGPIAMVVGFCGTLLTLFGPKTPAAEYEYLKFAVMLILFLVILIGSYWFVMVPSGRNGGRENPTGRDAEERQQRPTSQHHVP